MEHPIARMHRINGMLVMLYFQTLVCSLAIATDTCMLYEWNPLEHGYIEGHDLNAYSNVTEDDCITLCMKEDPYCKSVEYLIPSHECHTSEVDKTDVPSGLFHTSPFYRFHSRYCSDSTTGTVVS